MYKCTFITRKEMCVRKMINRKLSLILLLFSFFIMIGSVSAAENTTNNATAIEYNSVDVDCIDQKNAVEINDLQTANNNLSDVDNSGLACNHANNTGGNYSQGCVNASTFFNYFDENGVLRNNITCDSLVFEGNFNLNVSTININHKIDVIGKNATLNGVGFKITANDVSIANMNILINNTDIDAAIDVIGNNIKLFNNTLCVVNSGFGVLACGANSLNVSRNEILFYNNKSSLNGPISLKDSEGVDINGNYIVSVMGSGSAVDCDGVANADISNNRVYVKYNNDSSSLFALNINGGSNTIVKNNTLLVTGCNNSCAVKIDGGDITVDSNIVTSTADNGSAYGMQFNNVAGVLENNSLVVGASSFASGVIASYSNLTVSRNNFTVCGNDSSKTTGVKLVLSSANVDGCVIKTTSNNATNGGVITYGSNTFVLGYLPGLDIDVPVVVKGYGSDDKLQATLSNDGKPLAGVNVTFTVNGVNYIKTTDANGVASLNINLCPNFYNVTAYAMGMVVESSVKVSSILAHNLVKTFQNSTQFAATFCDESGKILTNTDVLFYVNGIVYQKLTDANGVAGLNINLRPGDYTLTALNLVTGEECKFNVCVLSTVETHDLVKTYKNASHFVIKVLNKDGSLANNTKVTFNINGVFYTEDVVDGYSKLNINLNPGKYIVTTIYNGLEVGNSIVVNSKLFSSNSTSNSSSFSDLGALLNFTNKTLYGTFDIINIGSSSEFKKVISNVIKFETGSKNVILNLTSKSYSLDATQDIVFNFNSGNLIIKGNGAKLTTNDGDVFLRIGTGATAQIFNCTFTNCKPAIRSYGMCNVVNCIFKENKRANTVNAHNLFRKGGAIDSYGQLSCINCSFLDNSGSYGGAVCCEPNSEAVFANCKWGSNTAGSTPGVNCGEDIFVHNSAFAQIFYNGTSEKPEVGTMASSSLQWINLNMGNTTNNLVFDVNNDGELINAFSYLNNGEYSATNVTINLKNGEYSFEQYSNWFSKAWFNVWDFTKQFFSQTISLAKGIWGHIENSYHESEDSDMKDTENSDYLCIIKSGLNVTINGNGATIKSSDADLRLFYIVGSSQVFLNNITIAGFGTAILNNGILVCEDTNFKDNRVSYVVDFNDLGGAVRNYGICNFTHTNFVDNYANKGGAIYNEGGQVILDNTCTFSNNKAGFDFKSSEKRDTIYYYMFGLWVDAWSVVQHYCTGSQRNDIYDVGGLVKINGAKRNEFDCDIKCENEETSSIIYDGNYWDNSKAYLHMYFLNKDDYTWLLLHDNSFAALNITLAPSAIHDWNYTSDDVVKLKAGNNLVWDGKGVTINAVDEKNNKVNDEVHFLINYGGNVVLKNFVLKDFNKAIINSGQIVCINVTFDNCRVDYVCDDDYGGAVHNTGNMVFINCTFTNNYAKYGAAVYNLGFAEFINCTAVNNVAYSSGAAFYDDKQGCSKFANCTFDNSKYILNEGPSMTVNSVWTYIKNNLLNVVIIGSFAMGYGQLSSGWAALAGVLGTAGDVAITSWFNVANHNHVGFGDMVSYSLLSLFKYVITALTAHQIGYKIYSALHPQDPVIETHLFDGDSDTSGVEDKIIGGNSESVSGESSIENGISRDITGADGATRKFVLQENNIDIRSEGHAPAVNLDRLSAYDANEIFSAAEKLAKSDFPMKTYSVKFLESGAIKDSFCAAVSRLINTASSHAVLKEFSMSIADGVIYLFDFVF